MKIIFVKIFLLSCSIAISLNITFLLCQRTESSEYSLMTTWKNQQDITDSCNNIELELKFHFPSEESVEKGIYLYGASDISSDLSGNIYISNTGADQVLKFDFAGHFLSRIGRRGQGPGEFSKPSNILFYKDLLIVHDSNNRRIQIFTKEGKYLRYFKLFKAYRDMVISDEGLIFAAPIHYFKEDPLIDVITLEGKLLYSFGKPLEFSKDWTTLNFIKLALLNNRKELFIAFNKFPIVRRYSIKGELLEEYRIKHELMVKRGKVNIKRSRIKGKKGVPVLYWIVINTIQVTDEEIYLLNFSPTNLFVTKLGNNGEILTSYHYNYKKEYEDDYYYSSDFIIKNLGNKIAFYVLQMRPDNRVDVFYIK